MNESTKIIEGRIVSYSTSFSTLGCRYAVVENPLPGPHPVKGEGVYTFQGQRLSLRVPLSFDHLYVVPGTEMYGKVFASERQRPVVRITYVPASLNEDRFVKEMTILTCYR